METEERCPFYRSIESSNMEGGKGYCEFDYNGTICDGRDDHCRKLKSLKQYLMGREWMKMRVNPGKSAGK